MRLSSVLRTLVLVTFTLSLASGARAASPYACEVTRYGEEGAKGKTERLTVSDAGDAAFEGASKDEKASLRIVERETILEIVSELPAAAFEGGRRTASKQDRTYALSITCDQPLNCAAKRTLPGGKVEPMNIYPGSTVATALLGKRRMFDFGAVPEGFKYTYTQLDLGGGKYVGFDVTCRSKK